MDFPWAVTPSCPKWPLKRQRLGRESDINIVPGPGLSLDENQLFLRVDDTLTFRDGQFLGVRPELLKPFSQQNIFSSGDFGSRFFRIPFLISLRNGNLIAGSDVRFESSDDFHRTCIGIAISEDGGFSWPVKTVPLVPVSRTLYSRYLDACIAEDSSGRIHLFAVYFQIANHLSQTDPNYDFVHTFSDDGGYNWSEPDSLKYLLRAGERYFFQCPGNGTVMEDGTLIIPCQAWQFSDSPKFYSTLIYSKDCGKTWVRPPGKGINVNSSECMIVEFPIPGTLLLVAKAEMTPNNISDRTRIVMQSSDLGVTWTPHLTNKTLRMRNPCQGSLFKYATAANEWVVLHASPNCDYSQFDKGRSNIVLQYLTAGAYEWVPIGVIDRRITFGYTGITLNPVYNMLYVITEIPKPDGSGSEICLHNCTRFLPRVTESFENNVCLGHPVCVNTKTCSHGKEPLCCRRQGKELWLSGQLKPPESGKFPEEMDDLVIIKVWAGTGSGVGWLLVVGSKTDPATETYPFLLEYYYKNNGWMGIRCFKNSAALEAGHKLSEMKLLYFPDCRIAVMN